MKVLVCGSRHWTNEDAIHMYLWRLLNVRELDFEIIEGGARGADASARKAAEKLGIKVTTVNADWEKYGRSAGPRRNRQMLDMLNPDEDMVLAFHEDLSKSRGTLDTICEANRRRIPVELRGGA